MPFHPARTAVPSLNVTILRTPLTGPATLRARFCFRFRLTRSPPHTLQNRLIIRSHMRSHRHTGLLSSALPLSITKLGCTFSVRIRIPSCFLLPIIILQINRPLRTPVAAPLSTTALAARPLLTSSWRSIACRGSPQRMCCAPIRRWKGWRKRRRRGRSQRQVRKRSRVER